jgi:hypothetical protein
MRNQRGQKFKRKAIKILKNGTATESDEIPAEAIKADSDTAVNILHSLFSQIWMEEKVPAVWKEGIIIKLPKKKETSGIATSTAGSC